MSGRRVGLLLLILVMGGAVDAAWLLRQNVGLGPTGCRMVRGRFYGPSFSFQAEETRPLAAGGTVEVENAFGGVRVTRAAAPELRVALRKVVYRPNEDLARDFAERIRLQVDAGAAVRVSTNREQLERSDRDVGFETHLELSVPEGTAVVVRNEHGRIEVADVAAADVSGSFEPVRVERVQGAAEVRARHADVRVAGVGGTLSLSARHGSVQVEDVQGACTLDVEHGDASLLRTGAVRVQGAYGEHSLQDVRGDLEVRARHAGVRAEDVDGRATVETSFEPVELRRVGGEARIKVDHGGIVATDIDGPLTAEGSFEDVELARVAGALDVRASHAGVRASDFRQGGRITALGGEVRAQRFAGPLEVDAQRSSLHLQPAEALTEPLVARTTFGDIRLYVPQGSRMALEATATRGEITVDVPGMSVTREAGGRASGTLQGGTNAVRLSADHGNIELSAALAATAGSRGDDEADEEPAETSRRR